MKVDRNLSYVEHGHPRHRLEIYRPAAAPAPVVVFVSGGGWRAGSRHWIAGLGEHLAANGFVAVLADHRLLPEVTERDQAADLAAAVAWVVGNIEQHGGDPTRVIAGGHSAGGHLVALMATDPTLLGAHDLRADDVLRGVIVVSGVVDHQQQGAELRPISHVRAGLPPFLLSVASDDMATLPESAQRMHERLLAAGVESELHTIEGTDHFSVLESPENLALISRWVGEHTR